VNGKYDVSKEACAARLKARPVKPVKMKKKKVAVVPSALGLRLWKFTQFVNSLAPKVEEEIVAVVETARPTAPRALAGWLVGGPIGAIGSLALPKHELKEVKIVKVKKKG
jgi:hypothetical protein